MAGRREAFNRNPELQRFLLTDVRHTGKQLGVGSYGSVEELEVNGVICAGKRLHEVLVEQGNAGVPNIVRKYLQECQVMTEMRHPHIVQFLGLCFLECSALPVLVMERLDSSLDELLEGTPSLPLTLKRSLLADVARGLLYLHMRIPPIVHRDLSARNVLLTSSLVAKISDLGNARIVNLQPGQLAMTLTHLPGTMVYMAPEAFSEGSHYGPKLDIFSFGHLALFTLTQVFPGSLLPHNYADPQNPNHLLARSELERRRDYIQSLHGQLGEQHPLVQLVHQCLHNISAQRPSAEDLLQQIEAVRAQIEGPYGGQLKKVDVVKVGMMKALREIESLQEQVQQLEELGQREAEAKDVLLQQRDAEIERQQRELQALREEMKAKDTQLQLKDDQLQQKDSQLQYLGTELTLAQSQLHQLQAEMDARSTQTQQQLQDRDAEISRLQRDLRIRPPTELRLKWRRLTDLLRAMASPHSVIIDATLYVAAGGGSRDIHKYNLQTQQWTKLPQYQYYNFTMAEVNHQLILVGGYDVSTGKTSNAVVVHPTPQGSTQHYPPLNTPHRYPSVSKYHQHLVVAGGCDTNLTSLANVEALDISSHHKQWISTTPLPVSCYRMSSTIVNEELYLLGGTLGKQVLSISLPALTHTDKPPAQWHTPPSTPLENSTAIVFHGSILLVGGSHDKQRSSAIYTYHHVKNMWTKVGDLPTERECCTCCVLPSGEILVAGGQDCNGRTNRMDVATVMD